MNRIANALALLLALPACSAFAQETGVLKGEAAFGGWRDDRPGVRRLFAPQDLPKPFATESAGNGAEEVERPENAKPTLPPGFSAELVASGLRNPRVVRVAPNGDIFVADSSTNQIRTYRLAATAGQPAQSEIFAKGLRAPYGIAFYPPEKPEWVYVANTGSVVRFPYKPGDLEASGPPQAVIKDIPTGGHWTRDIAFSPDGLRLALRRCGNQAVLKISRVDGVGRLKFIFHTGRRGVARRAAHEHLLQQGKCARARRADE